MIERRGQRAASAAPDPPSLFEEHPRERPPATSRGRGVPSAEPGAVPASAISISTLAAASRDIVEGSFPALWVRGEVVDLKRHRSGHWYFGLKDHSAQVRCVLWQSDQRRLLAAPDDGMEVLARGQLTVYPARSELQFRVFRLESVGDGLWRKAFEDARRRLETDGLLAPERKRPLPRFPHRIAVITSLDGAALHDVIAVVRRRCPIAEIVAVPAAVQGDGAPASLRRALARVSRWKDVDVVIIGRGGGSREDLWAFNDESVARAVAACPVPTIAAIGHEIDVTLCDLVADRRAATPSAAGEAAVPLLTDLREQLDALAGALGSAGERTLGRARERAVAVAQAMSRAAARLLDRRQLQLDGVAGRLHALSPLNTLSRGFAVVSAADGRVVSSVRRVSIGDALNVRLKDGTVAVRAEGIDPGAPADA